MNDVAERVGFEPTEPVRVQRFSRPPDSTALAPHRDSFILTSRGQEDLFFARDGFAPHFHPGEVAPATVAVA